MSLRAEFYNIIYWKEVGHVTFYVFYERHFKGKNTSQFWLNKAMLRLRARKTIYFVEPNDRQDYLRCIQVGQPFTSIYHSTLSYRISRNFKLWLCSYGQILPVNLFINYQISVIYGKMAVNYKERVLCNMQCDQKKSPNVYKTCTKMIFLEKW